MNSKIIEVKNTLRNIINHNNTLYEQIRELDEDGLVQVDWVSVENINDLSFSFGNDEITVHYSYWSFGEDFSETWAIPYEILNLSEGDIPEYVASKIKAGQKELAHRRQSEINRLKRQLEILEQECYGEG